MTRYGFRDNRTGQVTICFAKEDALRVATNSITGRYVAVVRVGDEWWELLNGAPALPRQARRAPRRSAGVATGSQPLYLRLWRKLRPDSGQGTEFVRHNG